MKLLPSAPLPSAPLLYPPYSVLYIDPPWTYRDRSGGTWISGSRVKYEDAVLTIEELKRLPIGDLAAQSAVLALWATVPLGDEPHQVLRAWGFTYKTAFFWIKMGRLGMGRYFRGDVEMLLFGTRGKIKPFGLTRQRNYHLAPVLSHSAKPEWFRDLVERATREVRGKRLELFARERAIGWDATGLELDGCDLRLWRKSA